MHKAVDLFLVYHFLQRLATPFIDWDAYKTGVIDDKGEILIKKPNRTAEQKKSFGIFDLMVLKLKKLLAKIPGGSSKIASYMAALWLIKEWNHFSNESLLNESVSESDIDLSSSLFLEWYLYYIPILTEVNRKITEDGEGGAPTVNVGSGNIAGLGVGPQGEPGLTRAQQRKHRKRAAETLPDAANRKLIAALLGELNVVLPSKPHRIGATRRHRMIKYPKQTNRIA